MRTIVSWKVYHLVWSGSWISTKNFEKTSESHRQIANSITKTSSPQSTSKKLSQTVPNNSTMVKHEIKRGISHRSSDGELLIIYKSDEILEIFYKNVSLWKEASVSTKVIKPPTWLSPNRKKIRDLLENIPAKNVLLKIFQCKKYPELKIIPNHKFLDTGYFCIRYFHTWTFFDWIFSTKPQVCIYWNAF